jgi:hypothetical protein
MGLATPLPSSVLVAEAEELVEEPVEEEESELEEVVPVASAEVDLERVVSVALEEEPELVTVTEPVEDAEPLEDLEAEPLVEAEPLEEPSEVGRRLRLLSKLESSALLVGMTTPEVGKTLLIQLESWASFVGKGMSMSAEVEGARVVWAETAPATARRTRVDFMLAVETSLI